MKSMKKLVLAGLVLLASVVVLAGCDTPLEPESTTVNEQAGGSENDSVPEVPKYTVKFAKGNNTDEVSDLPADLTVESGTVLTAEQLKPLSYTENYAFVGWYDGETEALAGTYKVTKAVTLTAQWKKGIIVTAKNFNEGLQSAISDPDSILVLEDDITVLETITISSGNVTIDLNGKTLKNESRTVVQVAEGATLTIMDTGTKGSIKASGDYVVWNYGSLEVTDGEISGVYSGVRNYGSLEVTGGSISGTDYGVENDSSGKLTVTDGEISGVVYGVKNYSSGKLEVTGGNISGNYSGVKNYSSGKLTVTGGNISGNYSGVDNQGELTVTGGSIKASNDGGYGVQNSGKLEVTGGNISGNYSGVDNQGELTVTGGNINGNYSGVDNQGELTVTGGSIKASGDGSYGVKNSGILYLSGAPVITSESYGVSFYLEETITLVGDLTGGNSSYSVAWRGATTGGTEIVVGGSISEGEDPFELTDEIENRFTFKASISSVYEEIEVELDTEKNALVLASVKE